MIGGLSGTLFPILAGVLVAVAWPFPFFLYALAIPAALNVYLRFEELTAQDPTAITHGTPHGGDPFYRRLLRVLRRPPFSVFYLPAC